VDECKPLQLGRRTTYRMASAAFVESVASGGAVKTIGGAARLVPGAKVGPKI